MPDAVELVKLIKQAAVDAVSSMKPVSILFGEVVNISPLQINVEQKLLLGENQLILSRNVTEYETNISVEWETGETGADVTHGHESEINISVNSMVTPEESEIVIENTVDSNVDIKDASMNILHLHEISGRKKIIVHNSLVVGDIVILIRQQEGQKYIVLDRIGK